MVTMSTPAIQSGTPDVKSLKSKEVEIPQAEAETSHARASRTQRPGG